MKKKRLLHIKRLKKHIKQTQSKVLVKFWLRKTVKTVLGIILIWNWSTVHIWELYYFVRFDNGIVVSQKKVLVS